jgi:hypothetical protein
MKPPTIEEWAAAEVAAMKPAPAPKGVTEEAIAEKTALGLTRRQAIAVLAADAPKTKPAKGK